jgi:hypothetical protein
MSKIKKDSTNNLVVLVDSIDDEIGSVFECLNDIDDSDKLLRLTALNVM